MNRHPRFLRLIDRLFVEGLSRRSFARLHAHVVECPGCRAEFNRVMAIASVMEKVVLPAVLSQQVELTISTRRPDVRSRTRSFLLSLAPAATVAVVVLVLLALPLNRRTAGFGARGTHDVASAPSVRAFCVGHDETGRAFVRDTTHLREGPSLSGPELSCTIRDHLQFAYRRARSKEAEPWDYLFIVGVDESLEVLWYKPRPPQRRSVRLEGGHSEDVVLPGATRLEVNHRPGSTRILAIHSREPVDGDEITRAVERLRIHHADLRKLTGLQLDASVVERTALMRIDP